MAAITFAAIAFQTSCFEEQHPGTYYTFTGYTVASFLESRPDNFSEFVKVLKKANLWSELSTYGFYTCFAPDNNAVNRFVHERGELAGKTYDSVDDLPKSDCDTLAWTHLLEMTCYVAEMVEGSFPKVNMNDRFLMLSFDSVSATAQGDTIHKLTRRINKLSSLVEYDDTVENGVVHVIDRCIDFSGDYIFDIIDNDRNTILFSEALKLTGLQDSLKIWYDDKYHIGDDSIDIGVPLTSAGNNYTVYYWEKKKTCFTIFVEPDDVYSANGIDSLEALIDYAKTVYDQVYPEDSTVTDFTDRRNSLNRFISYHILPFYAGYNSFNPRSDIVKMYNAGIIDPEDYFETMCPHTLMRISTDKQSKDVLINHRGKEGKGIMDFNGGQYRGIRICPPTETGEINQIARNGIFHYIDGILVYDNNIRENILDRRLRVDCTTLSPDFITAGARQQQPLIEGEKRGFGFKQPKNFHSYSDDFVLSVRAASTSSYAYEGDGIDIQGNFDMYVKLPPIPHDGTWQLRISFRSNDACGIIQQYLGEGSVTDWKPLGIPSDLRVTPTDPSVGWVKDEELENQEAVDALDKSLKNRGWMKGADSQLTNQGVKHRDQETMARRILCTEYMYADRDYYLRLKQILDNSKAEYLFDYIELVPKSVYDNGEDKH